jgi:hypothetical protein
MKFSPKNALLKNLTYFLAGSLLYPVQAAQLPWYHTYFHEKAGANYAQNVSFINFTQKIRYVARMLYYHTTHKKDELDQALLDIETELKKFEDMLLELEQKTLLAIKQKYAISDKIWHTYCADVEKIKTYYKTSMSQPHKEVIHDPAIGDIKDLLSMFLQENNINPQSVNMVMADDETIRNTDSSTMATTTFLLYPDKSNQKLIMLEYYTPISITIFPSLKESSWETKLSICAHEVQHIISQHIVPSLILVQYLTHYYSIIETDIKQTHEYQKLMQIHEAQAEILAALANRSTAACMKMFRQRFYYPNTLYEEHFYHLSSIDMLWKLHDKLEALYFS